ncbi:MAG: hypothetical protein U5O39_07385 [Gammaproteobacteria bacterium]|nr:hypothetical protein [Gammaproteobacteria bacterium]
MKKDDIFVKPLDRVDDFAFDARVADVFENMITRSVPGYRLILDLIGLIAEKYARPDTRCYDLDVPSAPRHSCYANTSRRVVT